METMSESVCECVSGDMGGKMLLMENLRMLTQGNVLIERFMSFSVLF